MLAVWIGAATSDLTTGEDIGPVNGLPLRILDAIHVRRAFERGEIGDRVAFPDTARIALQLKYRASGIDPIAVVGDVTDARFSEHHIDVLSIRRPYRKSQVRSVEAVGEKLSRAEPPRIGKIEILSLRDSRRLQIKDAVPI